MPPKLQRVLTCYPYDNSAAIQKTDLQKSILENRHPSVSKKLLIVTLSWLKSHKLLSSGNKLSRLNSYGATWLVLEYLLHKNNLDTDFMDIFSDFANFTAERLKMSNETKTPIYINPEIGPRTIDTGEMKTHEGFGLIDPITADHNIAGNMNDKFINLLKFV